MRSTVKDSYTHPILIPRIMHDISIHFNQNLQNGWWHFTETCNLYNLNKSYYHNGAYHAATVVLF